MPPHGHLLHARVEPSLGPALALTAGVNYSSLGTSVRPVYRVHPPGRTHSQRFRVLTKETDSRLMITFYPTIEILKTKRLHEMGKTRKRGSY